jgi:hypothetical protein
MNPLTRDDLLGRDAYEAARDDIRRQVMRAKQPRRVHVGGHCTFLFENRETLRYQIHEMLRTEGSWERADAVEEELTAYNPLLPGDGALSVTMLIEYETPEERATELAKLGGIDQHVWLQVGDTDAVLATFDDAQISEDGRVSSVQYIRFTLSPEQQQTLAVDGTVVRLTIDHPAYQAQAVLSEETRKALAADAT